MAEAAAPTALECPVCDEEFTVPKILPCAHLVCRKCILSWLNKGGNQAGCPLCRAPIFPNLITDDAPDDFTSLVDTLPTDLATAAMAQSEKTLSSSDACNSCENEEGEVFCLQCAIKLCNVCSKFHSKLPATKDHVTEKLSNLSAEQLVFHQRVGCPNHNGERAEMFCATHEQLMCMLCASSAHRLCTEVKRVGEVAGEKREEIQTMLGKLKERKTSVMVKISQLDTEISEGQAKFKDMRDEVKATFDDLQASIEVQRQKLNDAIKEREETYLAERKSSKLDLENYDTTLSAHKTVTERLLTSAPDCSLVSMMGRLKSRLADLELQALPNDMQSVAGDLALSSAVVDKTKEILPAVLKLTDSDRSEKNDEAGVKCLWCGRSPLEGPEYAAVIKGGDRVRPGKDWMWGPQDGIPPKPGTVTHVPANLRTEWVKVKWVTGRVYSYRMGVEGCYDLKKAVEEF